MPFLHIRTINKNIDACDDGRDYADLGKARKAAIYAGGRIALSELNEGCTSTIIEVRLEETGGGLVDRFAVSTSVSDLKAS